MIMCGINGFNFSDEQLIKKMNMVTAHRGPDGNGIFLDDSISLGHNRLSIIDLRSVAAQPMFSDDGNLVIVFNGEIYNFKELKKELEKSYNFKSQSDTEVILASFKKWGHECVKKFNGIFAFAIWDKDKQELFLARDLIGVKPLYYYYDGKRFIFSSEIKAILQHNISRILNKEALNHYLRILCVPEPLTMFADIYKFPPASFVIFKNGKLDIKKYWEADENNLLKCSAREIKKLLYNTILEATNRQLISDRPVGVYLSGGIDSSVVLYCMSQNRSQIQTFTSGFELSDKGQNEKFNQDFYLARKTAKFFNTRHHELLITAQDVLDNFEKAVWHLDEPISNPTFIPMFCLARFTKANVDVVLNGDGGDELFGGYERYRLNRIADFYQSFLPSPMRKRVGYFSDSLRKLDTPPGVKRFALFMFVKNEVIERVLSEEVFSKDITEQFFSNKFFKDKADYGSRSVLLDVDLRSWFVDEPLTRTDKMSMSSGLEARVPLLDKEVVELAHRIPAKYKVGLFSKKMILKEAFRQKLPPYLFDQPKRGWFAPGAKWLRHDKINKFAKQILSPSYYPETSWLFKWPEIEEMFIRHCRQGEYNFTILWAVLTFQIWAKLYKIKLPR